MKVFGLFVMLAGTMSLGGCLGTPAYSGQERMDMISRNMNYDGGQAVDDLDRFLLLRPPSHMTVWNIRDSGDAGE